MMKRKHLAAIAFMLAVIPLGISRLNALKTLQAVGYTQAAATPLVLPVNIPGPGVVREIVQLTEDISTLDARLASDETHVDLTLFGYEPSEPRNNPNGLRGSAKEENPATQIAYEVTMAFAGETKGFCVIDGRFYPEGGILPDGAKIVTVEARRVLVHKFNLKRWIPVSENVDITLRQKR